MNLKELRAKLDKALADMERLNSSVVDDKGNFREFSKEEQEEYSKLEAEVSTLKEAITRAAKIAEARSVGESLDRSTGAPLPSISVTRAENHDEKGRYIGFRNLGEQLQAVAKAGQVNGKVDKKLEELRAATGLNTIIDEEGAFPVQADFMVDLMNQVAEESQIASLCRTLTASSASNRVEIVTIDEKSRANGSRSGGVRAYWRDEAEKVDPTKPKLGLIKIELESLMAMGYATEETLQDAPLLEGLMRQAFVEEMGYELDEAILFGDGAGKPLGIYKAPACITVPKEGGQSNDTFVFANASKMYNLHLYARGASRAVWVVNQELKPELEKMYIPLGSATGLPVYQPAGASPSSLYGRPIIVAEQAKKLGDFGDIGLHDFSQYALIRKGTIDAQQSIHVRFEYGERAFRFMMRVGGQPLWKQAVTPANATGTRKVSPFVGLEAR